MPTPLRHNSPVRVGTLDTTRPTNVLRTTRESPPATTTNNCSAMVYLRPLLTRHSKLLWKRFARSPLPPTKQPTPTHSSTRRYVHIKQWPKRGKRDSPISGDSRRRRSSPAKNAPRSVSSTPAASTQTPPTVEATSSTNSCQPWRTSDSKSASQHVQKRKQLHSSRPTSRDHTGLAKQQAGQAGQNQGQA
jgi:hypothetical protein